MSKVKRGRLIEVTNKNRKALKSGHKTGAKNYVAVWVEDENGKNERCLLFTPNAIKVAENRADKNPEDIPSKGWLTNLLD